MVDQDVVTQLIVRLLVIDALVEDGSLAGLLSAVRNLDIEEEDGAAAAVDLVEQYLKSEPVQQLLTHGTRAGLGLLITAARRDGYGVDDDGFDAAVLAYLGTSWRQRDASALEDAVVSDVAIVTLKPRDLVGACIRSEVALVHAVRAASREPLLAAMSGVLLTEFIAYPSNVYYRARLGDLRLRLNELILDAHEGWTPFATGVRCRVAADRALRAAARKDPAETLGFVECAATEFRHAVNHGFVALALEHGEVFIDQRCRLEAGLYVEPLLHAADAAFAVGAVSLAVELFGTAHEATGDDVDRDQRLIDHMMRLGIQ